MKPSPLPWNNLYRIGKWANPCSSGPSVYHGQHKKQVFPVYLELIITNIKIPENFFKIKGCEIHEKKSDDSACETLWRPLLHQKKVKEKKRKNKHWSGYLKITVSKLWIYMSNF